MNQFQETVTYSLETILMRIEGKIDLAGAIVKTFFPSIPPY
jgi:hypothetical protein